MQVWLESTKATVSAIDPAMETQISGQVLGQLMQTYAAYVPSWVDSTTTPEIVQQVIAMFYAGWYYDRQFSEMVTNEAQISYGATLRAWAQALLQNIITGSISIVEIQPNKPAVAPVFYPNDQSSTWQAWANNTDCNDKSLGPAKFGMGMVF